MDWCLKLCIASRERKCDELKGLQLEHLVILVILYRVIMLLFVQSPRVKKRTLATIGNSSTHIDERSVDSVEHMVF